MIKGRNHKARILSHICQGVLLNVGSLTKEGRNAFPQLLADVSKWGARDASKKQSKTVGLGFKIEAQSFHNRALGPPKSSPEPSKTQFLKTFNLRRLKQALHRKVLWPK